MAVRHAVTLGVLYNHIFSKGLCDGWVRNRGWGIWPVSFWAKWDPIWAIVRKVGKSALEFGEKIQSSHYHSILFWHTTWYTMLYITFIITCVITYCNINIIPFLRCYILLLYNLQEWCKSAATLAILTQVLRCKTWWDSIYSVLHSTRMEGIIAHHDVGSSPTGGVYAMGGSKWEARRRTGPQVGARSSTLAGNSGESEAAIKIVWPSAALEESQLSLAVLPA